MADEPHVVFEGIRRANGLDVLDVAHSSFLDAIDEGHELLDVDGLDRSMGRQVTRRRLDFVSTPTA
jgi:hypothetical protein